MLIFSCPVCSRKKLMSRAKSAVPEKSKKFFLSVSQAISIADQRAATFTFRRNPLWHLIPLLVKVLLGLESCFNSFLRAAQRETVLSARKDILVPLSSRRIRFPHTSLINTNKIIISLDVLVPCQLSLHCVGAGPPGAGSTTMGQKQPAGRRLGVRKTDPESNFDLVSVRVAIIERRGQGSILPLTSRSFRVAESVDILSPREGRARL